MSISRKQEARSLSADERELVEQSHHPYLQGLADEELSKFVGLVRNRRDKAQTQANQRRRELRRKGSPRGARPVSDDEGNRMKVQVLSMAMRRLNSEMERRRRMAAAVSLQANARKALDMKLASTDDAPGFNSRHARHGMRNKANQRPEDLIRPMELGRQRKAASVAQAKRDSR